MAEGTPKPHALTEEEVQEYITDYTKSAELAIEAGFDGIELHGPYVTSLPLCVSDISNGAVIRHGRVWESPSAVIIRD